MIYREVEDPWYCGIFSSGPPGFIVEKPVTRFILSDLHIGHKAAQYEVMKQAVAYIRKQAAAGDEVWGLGDWFHMDEYGFEYCVRHPMAQEFRNLAKEMPIRLMPGNHDHELEKYRENPALENPLSPIHLVQPFVDDGIWYCHGHEFDPDVQYLPNWILWLWSKLPRSKTPGSYRSREITEKYLIMVQFVHSRALFSLQDKAAREGRHYRGLVMGHTHLPMQQLAPDLPFLLNNGDMRHSATFTIKDDSGFHMMRWDLDRRQWNEILVARA